MPAILNGISFPAQLGAADPSVILNGQRPASYLYALNGASPAFLNGVAHYSHFDFLAAAVAPTVGADIITNGGFDADTDWNKGTGWTIGSGVAHHAAGSASVIQQLASLDDTGWYEAQYTLSNGNGFWSALIWGSGATLSLSHTADDTYIDTGRAIGTASGVKCHASAVIDIDDISYKPLSLPSLFSTLPIASPDVIAQVAITRTDGTQAGLVLNVDDPDNPANFLLAYLSGKDSVFLVKCVGGVYTTLVAAAVTYAAGNVLKVVKIGTSVSVFYNDLAVGTLQTVSDADIISNLNAGLFSTYAANSFGIGSIEAI